MLLHADGWLGFVPVLVQNLEIAIIPRNKNLGGLVSVSYVDLAAALQSDGVTCSNESLS